MKKEKKRNLYTEIGKEISSGMKPHTKDSNLYEALGFKEPKYKNSRKKVKTERK